MHPWILNTINLNGTFKRCSSCPETIYILQKHLDLEGKAWEHVAVLVNANSNTISQQQLPLKAVSCRSLVSFKDSIGIILLWHIHRFWTVEPLFCLIDQKRKLWSGLYQPWTAIPHKVWGIWNNKSHFNGTCNENAMEG